jgi:hypothetical protein
MVSGMSINVGPYVLALHDIAARSGLFDAVMDHEPVSAPDTSGLTCCIIGSSIVGIQSSGLASLSARVEFRVRILTGMLTEPVDAIDTLLLNAAGEYMGELVGAYALGGIARDVDLLGSDGEPLRTETGYMTIGGSGANPGNRMFRTADVLVPVVINDCWEMAA